MKKKDRQRIMISDIEEDPMMVASLKISKDESNVITKIIDQFTTNTETKLP